MDTTQQSPVIISLCTGMLRGLEVGIERALERPVKVAAYAEIEAFVVANLIAGMEAGVLAPAPVWTDLKTFPWRQFRGKVHGIIGGYPCQPFSVAGNQKGTDDPRHLWPFIKEGIKEIRPQFCFFENVRGHLKLGFEQVYNDLRELGYQVRFGIYSAEEVGAPHKRERLFILAILGRTNNGEQRTKRRDDEKMSSIAQYEWEEPRVVEPGLGCTINGYNFREDLLRGIGNGVVEQTAAKAFVDLLSKF